MADALMAMVPQYGLWLIALVTFLSCLAVPVPSSLLMVAGGAFAAADDLVLSTTVFAGFFGAVVGDQTGFAIGRKGSTLLKKMGTGGSQRRILFERARNFSANRGGTGVFLTRWLLSPLGPYVNFVSGASGLGWAKFSFYAAAGEFIWVSLYTGLGFVFSGQIEMVVDIAGNISGFLAATTLAIFLGRLALRPAKDQLQGELAPK